MNQPFSRRDVLVGCIAGVLPLASACQGKDLSFVGFSMVFESPSTKINIDRFAWSNMRNERGLFSEGGMHLSPQSPAEMAFMGEEVGGLVEWFEVTWRSPLVPANPDGDEESEYIHAKRYTQRVYPRIVVPQSVLEWAAQVTPRSERRVLKLKFIFEDSKLRLEYEKYQWDPTKYERMRQSERR